MKTFEPGCQWRAGSRRSGLRFAGLVWPGDKEPQTPGPGEARRAWRAPGLRVPAPSARAQSRTGPPGTDGPEPSASARVLGEAATPTAEAAERRSHGSRRRFSSACYSRGLVCRSRCTHRVVFTPEQERYLSAKGSRLWSQRRRGWWWCKPIRIPRILPAPSVVPSEGSRCAFGNVGSVRTPRPEGLSQKSRSAVSTLQVRCALLSALGAHVITPTLKYGICMHMYAYCVYMYMHICSLLPTALRLECHLLRNLIQYPRAAICSGRAVLRGAWGEASRKPAFLGPRDSGVRPAGQGCYGGHAPTSARVCDG